jgi:hypothetical protein
MSERDKATSIAKLMSAAGRKKTRQPIKVVKAAGPNRGIAGRPKGGSFLFSLLLTRSLLTMFFYSQGAVQDGRPTYEEGNAGTEKGVEKEEVDTKMQRGAEAAAPRFLPIFRRLQKINVR